MMRNKKAQIVDMAIVIVVIVTVGLIISASLPVYAQIGRKQTNLIGAYVEAEKIRNYIENAAKYSSFDALCMSPADANAIKPNFDKYLEEEKMDMLSEKYGIYIPDYNINTAQVNNYYAVTFTPIYEQNTKDIIISAKFPYSFTYSAKADFKIKINCESIKSIDEYITDYKRETK